MVLLICFHFVHRDCFYPALSGLSFYLLFSTPPHTSTCSTPPLKVCILIMIALGIGTGRLDRTAPSPWVRRYRYCSFSSPLIPLFFLLPSRPNPYLLWTTLLQEHVWETWTSAKDMNGWNRIYQSIPKLREYNFFLGIQIFRRCSLKPSDFSMADTLERHAIFCP